MSFLAGGGAECGPSNALATLGKRLGQDNGLQRDRYGPAAGSSSSAGGAAAGPAGMRTQSSAQGRANTAAFFDVSGPRGPMPYDMSPLQQALPHHLHQQGLPADAQRAAFESSFRNAPPPLQQQMGRPAAASSGTMSAATPAWAQDFLQSGLQHSPQPAQQQVQTPTAASAMQRPIYSPQFAGAMGAGAIHWQSGSHFPGMQGGFHADSPHAAVHAAHQTQKQTTSEPAWATAFAEFDQQQQHEDVAQAEQQPQTEEPQQQQRPLNTIEDADELAQTAGRLMETIAHEEDTKFKQSRFLDLMRRLRDREAGIEGTDIVAKDPSAAAPLQHDVKGKGRAMPDTAIEEYQTRLRQQYQPSQRGMDLAGPAAMRAPSADAMAEMNAMWAEEDAVRERNAMRQGAFVGDAGDVAARMAEDDAAQREFERYQRLGAQIPGSHMADWSEPLGAEDIVGTGTAADAYTSYAPLPSGAFEELRRAAMREPLVQHPHPHAESSRQGEAAAEQRMEEEEEEEGAIKSTDDFVGRKWEGPTGRGRPGHQMNEWDALQRDWDEFEATSMGIRPVQAEPLNKPRSPSFSQFTSTQPQPYRFAPNNPYAGRTRHHLAHWDGLHKSYTTPAQHAGGLEDSVLEREAAVQDDPTNAQAWYDLGVKQQENEREGLAISALHRAVQLDPKLQGAWLALAVSYTNENDRPAALEAIVRWMDSVGEYADVLAAHRAAIDAADSYAQRDRQKPPRDGTLSPISDSGSAYSAYSPDGLSASAKHQRVTEALIALARHGSAQGKVDADVQVALGVLFNASEDYDKAVDCFGAALSVRPEDWLLYNRLGATLSNSGRSDEAIKYYHHALSLQPEFVRCHFNLSISYLNLKMYRETAQHIYTALNLQRAESASNNPASATTAEMKQQLGGEREGGVASSSLWETFRVSLELLNRPDLARLCAQRDIDLFDPNDFVDPEHEMAEA
ncbi:hypothetical protein OC835_002885 [Tilletia horrida]|nr:hypothetical protein OC835_002885 [Tilletia horrida]